MRTLRQEKLLDAKTSVVRLNDARPLLRLRFKL